MTGLKTWMFATLVGLSTMFVIEALFRRTSPGVSFPVAQGIGLWAAWIVAWPRGSKTKPGGHLDS
jgi:hypothetical protein